MNLNNAHIRRPTLEIGWLLAAAISLSPQTTAAGAISQAKVAPSAVDRPHDDLSPNSQRIWGQLQSIVSLETRLSKKDIEQIFGLKLLPTGLEVDAKTQVWGARSTSAPQFEINFMADPKSPGFTFAWGHRESPAYAPFLPAPYDTCIDYDYVDKSMKRHGWRHTSDSPPQTGIGTPRLLYVYYKRGHRRFTYVFDPLLNCLLSASYY